MNSNVTPSNDSNIVPGIDKMASQSSNHLINLKKSLENTLFPPSLQSKIVSKTLSDLAFAQEEVGDATQTQYNRQRQEDLRRTLNTSVNSAVLTCLASKKYNVRRDAALEISKILRSLIEQSMYERVNDIIVFLSEDYARSVSENARKGGIMALATATLSLSEQRSQIPQINEATTTIFSSVIHACQDPVQRVRYYSCESLYVGERASRENENE